MSSVGQRCSGSSVRQNDWQTHGTLFSPQKSSAGQCYRDKDKDRYHTLPIFSPALIASDFCPPVWDETCACPTHSDGGSYVAFSHSGQLLPGEFLHCEIVPRLSK